MKLLQKEIATDALELMSHDHCKTSGNMMFFKALIMCNTNSDKTTGGVLLVFEMAPLLGKRGALGRKNACTASMDALASDPLHQR